MAVTGLNTGNAVAIGLSPIVSGFARYVDTNPDGLIDGADYVVIPFNLPIVIGNTTPRASNFTLPVIGDYFGENAFVVTSVPNTRKITLADNELAIFLGFFPDLRIHQNYNGTTTAKSPSGIDVIATNAIQSRYGGHAKPSSAIDIIPGFYEGRGFGGNSYGIALGDIDGDGDLDAVEVSSVYDYENFLYAHQIHTNLGNANFGPFYSQLLDVRNDSGRAVTLGDVDSDGDLDMVVANYNLGNQIYSNNGAGFFTDSTQSLGTYNSLDVALGDVDGDGDQDMVVANDNQGNRVYTNNGTGTFTDSTQS
ncbi:MAG: hypothetical protein GXO85_10580, partial [Chlorobi bacterium]|nr:hypothetical protein [Chlorobiota bacterium]